MADEVTIHNLVLFEFGELQDDAIALALAYATSQEKLSRGEMETFVIGMSREKAAELGRALLQKSGAAAVPGKPKQTEH